MTAYSYCVVYECIECEAIIDLTFILEADVSSRATIRLIKDLKVPERNETIEFDDEFFLTKMMGKIRL